MFANRHFTSFIFCLLIHLIIGAMNLVVSSDAQFKSFSYLLSYVSTQLNFLIHSCKLYRFVLKLFDKN